MATELTGQSVGPAGPWAEPIEAGVEPFDEPHWHEEYAYSASRPLARHRAGHRRLTQTLGWLSLGVGLAELLAPRAVSRAIGVGDHPAVMRMIGARAIVSGVGLLSEHTPASWAWSRVAGDAMDVALLGAAIRSVDVQPKRAAIAAAALLGVTALDVYASQRLTNANIGPPEIRASDSIAINATPREVYEFWSRLENLPLFMRQVQSVSQTNESTSHWVVSGPAGATFEWDAEIVDDQPGARLGWRALPDSEICHEGLVTFKPAVGGRGTIVRVELLYWPPAGVIGAQIARLLGEAPDIGADLRRLKQLIETGEIATTVGQPSGKRSLIGQASLGGRLQ